MIIKIYMVGFFWPKVMREDHMLNYFQQDGASPHRGNKETDSLIRKIGPQDSRLESMWLFSGAI